MKSEIIRFKQSDEFHIAEDCFVYEYENRPGPEGLSIARARVRPGVTTRRHKLTGVDERYLVLQGEGLVEIGDLEPTEIGPGDLVVIPAGVNQRVTNTGQVDLLFFCLCNPGFTSECYTDTEAD